MQHQNPFSKTEDFWAIVIGSFLLISSLIIFLSIAPDGLKEEIATLEQVLEKESKIPFQTIASHEAENKLAALKLSKEPVGQFLKKLSAKPNGWTKEPASAFFSKKPTGELDDKQVVEALGTAKEAEKLAHAKDFSDPSLNEEAEKKIEEWASQNATFQKQKDKRKPGSFSFGHLLVLFLLLLALFGFGAVKMGDKFGDFTKGFALVFLLALVSLFLASQKDLKDLGVEYAVWAIVFGMLISNTIGTPRWAESALKTEFYIKTGLIIMGAEVLFNKILAIGLPGMFVAWVVTPIVLISTFWFGQNVLKISSKSLNITISADMSVCGVSAAVATAAASKATREELTVAIGLSMIFTAIMMIVMPLFVKFVGMPEVLGGAWIGGTIDSSGAVVAAGAALGDKAMYIAATIKMIQNVLIGFVAFGVAVYFATKVEKGEGSAKVGVGEIWRRFPKFILGFVGASLLFTAIYTWLGDREAYSIIDQGVLGGFTKNLRTWLFCLAFVSIGLSTDFRVLKKHFTGGKPLLLYICGQTLNILLTLGMAYLMFYKVFPHVTESF
ncbi:MAG: putative sulfate exporter family transporter [Saprospiraceae bacterium]